MGDPMNKKQLEEVLKKQRIPHGPIGECSKCKTAIVYEELPITTLLEKEEVSVKVGPRDSKQYQCILYGCIRCGERI